MLLLILQTSYWRFCFNLLYIPLCFYLYWRWWSGELWKHNFTFHYASTYTMPDKCLTEMHTALHSTMLLLIHSRNAREGVRERLYIPLCFYLYLFLDSLMCSISSFTFHYASTYTFLHNYIFSVNKTLHSTMLLLIRRYRRSSMRRRNTLHSTMLLLIPDAE